MILFMIKFTHQYINAFSLKVFSNQKASFIIGNVSNSSAFALASLARLLFLSCKYLLYLSYVLLFLTIDLIKFNPCWVEVR